MHTGVEGLVLGSLSTLLVVVLLGDEALCHYDVMGNRSCL